MKRKKSYKGLYLFGGTLLVLVGLLAFLNTQGAKSELYGGKKTADLHPSTRTILNDPNYQQIIVPETMNKKLESKDSFFVYFFSPDCPSCQATTPELMPLAKEAGVFLHQYNLREYQEGLRGHNIDSTPTLVFYENGAEKERIVGGIHPGGNTKETFTQFFEKYKGSVKP